MQVSPSVRAVQVPDENVMRPQFTTIYLIGHGQTLTIDSGEDVERFRWMLKGYLAAVEKAEIAVAAITHFHFDHSGNLKWLRENFQSEILGHADGIPLLEGKLPDNGVMVMKGDGQVFDLGGGVRPQVLFTPGHSVDSVCYYLEDEGVLFTGDTLLGVGTSVMIDLFDYMQSLERLLNLPNLKVICPGHGPLVHDPRERLQQYIDHRNQRDRQVLEALGIGGEMTSWDIMTRIYTDIDSRLRRAADGNVQTHLKKLEREGRLKVYPGKRKEQTAEDRQKAETEAHHRAELLEQARKEADEARRLALAAQENPPSDQWENMPKYELIGKASE